MHDKLQHDNLYRTCTFFKVLYAIQNNVVKLSVLKHKSFLINLKTLTIYIYYTVTLEYDINSLLI